MEAAETAGERRRAILQAIGPEAKLVERKVGTYKNGRDLTKKFIEVKPYPWLEKLAKNAKKIAPEIDKGFNRDLQGENDRKSALYSEWWILEGSNLWPQQCECCALANWAKDPSLSGSCQALLPATPPYQELRGSPSEPVTRPEAANSHENK